MKNDAIEKLYKIQQKEYKKLKRKAKKIYDNCQSMARTCKRKRTHSQLHVHACRPELASTET